MVNANGCCLKIYFTLFLFIPLVSFAQQSYNVVKDYGFENNDTIWVGYKSHNVLVVDRHTHLGYESQYCGLTDTDHDPGLQWGFPYNCYLKQKLIKREAKDYNLDGNIRYYLKSHPYIDLSDYYDYWYISFTSFKKKLIFLYVGPSVGQIPIEDDTTHIVKRNIPPTDSWQSETLNFYEKWTEKFSETDTIEEIRLTSYGLEGGPCLGQKVWWDDIVFESTRPDSDAAAVEIGFSGVPTAKIQNKGAVAISFPTICDIFKDGNKVYSDTVQVESLAVDSTKEVSFKPYSDSSEMKIYTALPGDPNPANDTLTKSLGVQEVEVKKPVAFKVWPVFSRGMVNYESGKSVTVFDPMGRLIVNRKEGNGSFILEKTGVYFVRSGGEVKKIIRVE